MLTVHHLENSRSHRILWLFEELELDYEIEQYSRDPETEMAPEALKEVHPLGKAPVVTDGERAVAESGAIIEYVLDEHADGRLRPERGTEEYERYRYWMHYAEGTAMPPLLVRIVFSKLPEQAPWLLSPVFKAIQSGVESEYIQPQMELHLDFWEAELEDREFIVGDEFTAADIQMSFPVEAAIEEVDSSEYPRVQGLVDRLRERPGYRRAVERGGGWDPDW